MTKKIKFQNNKATFEEVKTHLCACSDYFVPPLKSRVDIDGYAYKIVQNALTCEAWFSNELIGLIALYNYCDKYGNRKAFISNVSVHKNWQNKGIASHLIKVCFSYLVGDGCKEVFLSVNKANSAALSLYEKYGFHIISEGINAEENQINVLSMRKLL